MRKELVIETAWCKGCGICVAFCPRKALTLIGDKVALIDETGCVLCGQCEMRCPDYAIYIKTEENRHG